MYVEEGLLPPLMPAQHGLILPDDLCTNLSTAIPSMGYLVQASAISDYDLGLEGDLFKAPEPILEEPLLAVDPITAAVSMISGGGSIVTSKAIAVTDMESIGTEDILSEAFFNCKEDLLAKSIITESSPEPLDVKNLAVHCEEGSAVRFLESLPNECLLTQVLDECEKDLGANSAISGVSPEASDIKTLGNNNTLLGKINMVSSSFKLLPTIGNVKIEERRQKLSRYRKKRTKRNFGRKIKYACRKALADSQPRIRGRFAKTEDRFAKPEESKVAKLQN